MKNLALRELMKKSRFEGEKMKEVSMSLTNLPAENALRRVNKGLFANSTRVYKKKHINQG